ncbi:MAG: hypothetical protein Q7R81_04270 [Candidatus Peregrinibacteria bacterium]|nr:hypothetical protein [Candidatus Peregrinibacteria bacterium]
MTSHTNIQRRVCLTILIALVLSMGGWDAIAGSVTAHAQGPNSGTDHVSATITQFADYTATFITASNVIMWLIFRFIDITLDPNFIFDVQGAPTGGAFVDTPLLDMLHHIWQVARDLVNVFFAILLIIGALYMIIRPDKAKETLSSMGPKFVLAVILVNFSWFIPRVIFDVGQITAYTAFQLPDYMDVKCEVPAPDGLGKVPCKIVTNVLFFDAIEKDTTGATTRTNGWTCPLPDLVCVQSMSFSGATVANVKTHSKVINGLIVNHARLQTLAQIGRPPPPTGAAPGAALKPSEIRVYLVFLMKMVIVLVINIALLFPMIAIFVAFIVRIPVLWITMAFMPFAVISMVIGDAIGEKMFDTKKMIWNKFLSAVFLPTFVAIPMSIGFIMINVGSNLAPPPALRDNPIPLLSGISNLWQMIWLMVSLGVMWVLTFQILEKDELTSKITGRIKGLGTQIGGAAMRLPLAVPIIPGVGGKPSKSLGGLMKEGSDIMSALKYNPDSAMKLIRGEKDHSVPEVQNKLNAIGPVKAQLVNRAKNVNAATAADVEGVGKTILRDAKAADASLKSVPNHVIMDAITQEAGIAADKRNALMNFARNYTG